MTYGMKSAQAFFIGILFALISAPPVLADMISIAGRTMHCTNVRIGVDDDMKIEGEYTPSKGLILNMRRLNKLPPAVAQFIFKHECAHRAVADEFAADCVAAHAGRQEGWLTLKDVKQVCHILSRERESGSHPSGTSRCANIKRCHKGQ